MKLIESQAILIPQDSGITGIHKQIELAGRTCYKSEGNITHNSAQVFVERMINSGHTAMLEHGTVYLQDIAWNSSPLQKYAKNKYSIYKNIYLEKEVIEDGNDVDTDYKYAHYVTTNLRVIVENGWQEDLKYICEPTEHHVKRISMRFITDRGVSHELVRHRVFSFAQESTRYCNYSQDKFGNEITYIIPSWSDIPEGTYKTLAQVTPVVKGVKNRLFFNQLTAVQDAYNTLIEEGCTPQEARQVLPNALKTEIVVTGFVSDWRHFFDLRLLGTTGKPHPDMLLLAQKAKKVLEENNLWELIYPKDEKVSNN